MVDKIIVLTRCIRRSWSELARTCMCARLTAACDDAVEEPEKEQGKKGPEDDRKGNQVCGW
jgi:hypothetical protein